MLSSTGFHADAADILSDDILPLEALEFLKTFQMTEVFAVFPDGSDRTGRDTGPAGPASAPQRTVRLQPEIRQDRH